MFSTTQTTLQTAIKDVSFLVLYSCTGIVLHYTDNVTNRHQRRLFCGIIRLYSNCAPLHNATNHHQRGLFCGIIQLYRNCSPLYRQRYKPQSKTSLLCYCTAVQKLLSTIQTTLQNHNQRRLFCGIVQLYRNCSPLYRQRYKPQSKTSLLWYCTAVQELFSTVQTTLQTAIKDVSFVLLYSCAGIVLHYTTLQTAIKDVSFVVLYSCAGIVLHYTDKLRKRGAGKRRLHPSR